MSSKNISNGDIEIIKKLLGEDVGEEFKRFSRTRSVEKNRGEQNRRVSRQIRVFVVDVSDFRVKDLVGYWDYDESYINDECYFKPNWYYKLVSKCKESRNIDFVVVFKGVENASYEVYKRLKQFKDTGVLTYDFGLPRNASYGEIEVEERDDSEKNKNNNGNNNNRKPNNRYTRRRNRRMRRNRNNRTRISEDRENNDYDDYDRLR